MNCVYCQRSIASRPSLASHQLRCKENPNKVTFKRSPSAGAQIGSTPWNKGVATGRNAKWDVDFPLDKVLVENSKYARSCLKRRILANKLLDYVCAICNQEPIWCGKEMPLILDHINGINNDNRLENLRFVCSNCDSQLPTYKSRNRKVPGLAP